MSMLNRSVLTEYGHALGIDLGREYLDRDNEDDYLAAVADAYDTFFEFSPASEIQAEINQYLPSEADDDFEPNAGILTRERAHELMREAFDAAVAEVWQTRPAAA